MKKGDVIKSSLLQEYIVLNVYYDDYLGEEVVVGKMKDGVATGKINVFPVSRIKE
jgi:hypothetical protein